MDTPEEASTYTDSEQLAKELEWKLRISLANSSLGITALFAAIADVTYGAAFSSSLIEVFAGAFGTITITAMQKKGFQNFGKYIDQLYSSRYRSKKLFVGMNERDVAEYKRNMAIVIMSCYLASAALGWSAADQTDSAPDLQYISRFFQPNTFQVCPSESNQFNSTLGNTIQPKKSFSDITII